MNVIETKLPGVLIVEPKVFGDQRGFFKETYQADRYAEFGIGLPFVQDNHSRSRKGVLRGLHLQKTRPQGKLVSCIRGEVYDVAVDINPKSETYGQYVGLMLTEENQRQLWIPPGYAHGFCVITDEADFMYKCTEYYLPQDEIGYRWDDEYFNIEWPIKDPIISEKDAKYLKIGEIGK